MAAIDPRLWSLIKQYSRTLDLDPYAVAAVSLMEGGGRFGAVGDNGSSFGPFQLHVGGALPPGKSAAWANSAQGVYYAMSHMATVAGGMRGAAAIANIVRRFERPAAPGPEVAGAVQHYRELAGRHLQSIPFASGHSPGQTPYSAAALELAAQANAAQMNALLLGRMSQPLGNGSTPAQALASVFPGTASSPTTPGVVNPVNDELGQQRTATAAQAARDLHAALLPQAQRYQTGSDAP